MVNKFQDHLSALKIDGLVGTWYCTELKAGEEWDSAIQKHFDESDIVCFMISPNFMKTDYIFKYEVKKALDRKSKDGNFMIVPIIMDFCVWQTQKYPIQNYTALPYTVKPITDFRNENQAWFIIVESLRIMIEKSEQFEGDSFFKDNTNYENSTLRDLFERLVKGELN
jgi:hypothetical protein